MTFNEWVATLDFTTSLGRAFLNMSPNERWVAMQVWAAARLYGEQR